MTINFKFDEILAFLFKAAFFLGFLALVVWLGKVLGKLLGIF